MLGRSRPQTHISCIRDASYCSSPRADLEFSRRAFSSSVDRAPQIFKIAPMGIYLQREVYTWVPRFGPSVEPLSPYSPIRRRVDWVDPFWVILCQGVSPFLTFLSTNTATVVEFESRFPEAATFRVVATFLPSTSLLREP